MKSRGFFGIGIWHAKHACNQGTLWRHAFAFGADFMFTIGPRFKKQASDTVAAYKHVPMLNYLDLSDLVAHLPYGCPLVAVELDENARSLDKFCHPEIACYLLGAEDHGLPKAIIDRCHLVVQIPGLRSCLNVATTGSIVMYDRITQRQRK